MSAEACAADAATDHGYFASWMLTEIFNGTRPSLKVRPGVDIYLATDCRSLYDAMIRVSGVMSDKRRQIEVASIKEMVSREGAHRVPTHEKHADAMTKTDLKLEEQMRQWLKAP